MKRLILVGSPRTNGRSAHLGEELFEALIEDCPEDELFLVPVSEIDVAPCIYCNACQNKSDVIVKDDDGNEVTITKHRCVFDDDMQAVYDIIDDVDEIIVVCPVFFSGAPAGFKSLLDRLQPYYWAQARLGEKRPATLHVIGEGGDPHGYGALVSEVRSALAVAGFKLERVLDWVGKIDVNGEIMAEAEEHLVDETSFFNDTKQARKLPSSNREMDSSWAIAEGAKGEEEGSRRPKLNLHQSSTASPCKSKKDGKSAKGTKAATKANGATRATKPAKTPKATTTTEPAKATKATKATTTTEPAKAAKAAELAKTPKANGAKDKGTEAATKGSKGDKGSRKAPSRG